MYEVPIIGESILARVLAHRRHSDAVAQCNAADRERCEQMLLMFRFGHSFTRRRFGNVHVDSLLQCSGLAVALVGCCSSHEGTIEAVKKTGHRKHAENLAGHARPLQSNWLVAGGHAGSSLPSRRFSTQAVCAAPDGGGTCR